MWDSSAERNSCAGRRRGVAVLVTIVIGIHVGLLAFAATRHSPTNLKVPCLRRE